MAVAIERRDTSSLLRALIDVRDRQIQKARIQFGNRLAAIENGMDTASEDQVAILRRYYESLERMEKDLNHDIEELVSEYGFYPILSRVKGIGPTMAAKLIALVDIRKCDTVSALWRFAGLAVIDGKAEKPVPGEKLHYSKRLKATMYLVAKQLMAVKGPYYDYYYEMRQKYESKHPDWPRLRIHLAALRKVEKLFLAHMWEKWRTYEGLPVRRPYVIDMLGHNNFRAPEEYGWP